MVHLISKCLDSTPAQKPASGKTGIGALKMTRDRIYGRRNRSKLGSRQISWISRNSTPGRTGRLLASGVRTGSANSASAEAYRHFTPVILVSHCPAGAVCGRPHWSVSCAAEYGAQKRCRSQSLKRFQKLGGEGFHRTPPQRRCTLSGDWRRLARAACWHGHTQRPELAAAVDIFLPCTSVRVGGTSGSCPTPATSIVHDQFLLHV